MGHRYLGWIKHQGASKVLQVKDVIYVRSLPLPVSLQHLRLSMPIVSKKRQLIAMLILQCNYVKFMKELYIRIAMFYFVQRHLQAHTYTY